MAATAKKNHRPSPGPRLNHANMQAEAIVVLGFLKSIDKDAKVGDKARARSDRVARRGAVASDKGDKEKALELYMQAYRQNPQNRAVLALMGGLLAGFGRKQEAIGVFERLMELGAPEPNVIYDIANLAAGLDMAKAAENLFANFIQLCPNQARGYTSMASLKRTLGKYQEAVDLLQYAIEQQPENAFLWESLALTVGEWRDVDAAKPFFDEALRLRPDMGAGYANYGRQLNAEGRFQEAEPLLRQAIKLLPESANTRFNFATALLGCGKIAEGWENYAWRLDKARPDTINFTHNLRRWTGGDLSDKVLLICDEQGIGDGFLFASLYNEIIPRAKHCVIECDRRMVPIFQRSFPDATFHRNVSYRVNSRLHRSYRWLEDLDHKPDLATEAGTLPTFLRPDLASFAATTPYLKADPERVAFWRERFAALGPGLLCGVTWRGGLRSVARDRSYATIEDFGAILAVPGVNFINCMYAECSDEIAYAKQHYGTTIHDWDDIDRRNDLDEATAYTAALDHMISVRSSPGAISSALGVPTFTLQRSRGNFMLGTDNEPWYPARRNFFAKTAGDWPDVPITRIADRLAEVAAAR